MESKHNLSESFKFAFEGIKVAVIKGRNFRIQIILAILATILGITLKISVTEWLDIAIIITLVLILELINTSIEAIVDLVSPQIQEKAKIAKDVAAAAVLVASIGSVVIGSLIFIPKLLQML